MGDSHIVFRQALLETRAIQAEVPTKLVGMLSLILCWKAFPQCFSEGYTIYNLASRVALRSMKYPSDVTGISKFCQVSLICLMVRGLETKNENDDVLNLINVSF